MRRIRAGWVSSFGLDLLLLTIPKASFAQLLPTQSPYDHLFHSLEQRRIQLLLQAHHPDDKEGVEEPVRPSELTAEEFIALIKNKNLTSIESLLPHLPLEMRSNLALVYDSGSQQGASYQNPRAILFTIKGHLAISFNEHADQRGFQKLDAMQWREDKKIFDCYEIDFEKKPVAIHENPTECFLCHGGKDDARLRRPILDSYQVWPQIYDSAEDLFSLNFDLGPDVPPQPRVNRETAEWKKFAQSAQTHPRYRHLNLDEYQFNLSKQLNHGVNARHSVRLMRMNLKRMANFIASQRNYRSIEPALVGALIGCDNIEEFFPNDVAKTPASLSDTYAEVQAYTNSEIAKQFDLLMQYVADEELKYNQSDYQNPQQRYGKTAADARLQFVLQKIGLDLSSFSMSRIHAMGLVEKSYMFNGFTIDGSDLIHFLPLSPEYSKARTYAWKERGENEQEFNGFCEGLKKDSLKKFSNQVPFGNEKEPLQTGFEVAKVHCYDCHLQNHSGTKPFAISFVDREKFQNKLRRDDSRLFKELQNRLADDAPVEIKMPPTHNLKLEQKNQLLQYILEVYQEEESPSCKPHSELENDLKKLFDDPSRKRGNR